MAVCLLYLFRTILCILGSIVFVIVFCLLHALNVWWWWWWCTLETQFDRWSSAFCRACVCVSFLSLTNYFSPGDELVNSQVITKLTLAPCVSENHRVFSCTTQKFNNIYRYIFTETLTDTDTRVAVTLFMSSVVRPVEYVWVCVCACCCVVLFLFSVYFCYYYRMRVCVCVCVMVAFV